MRPYGTVSPLFWIGETGKKLRFARDAQILALYLMTNPHSHQTGIYHLPLLYLATEIGMPIEGAEKALLTLADEGFCQYDEKSEWVWVCEMAAWQIGESLKDSDKRAIGVQQYLESVPKLPFITAFIERYSHDFHLSAPPQKRGSITPSEGLIPIRAEQNRNRAEQEGSTRGTNGADAPPPKAGRASRIPEDFTLTPSRLRFAADAGVDPERTFAKFRDYWRAVPGAKGTKLDWDATWRNWIRSEAERNPRAKGGGDNGLPFAN